MRLRIENFKSYSDTGFLDLKPLTLIFGKNSAGKSAVIQALNALGSTSFSGRPTSLSDIDLRDSEINLSFYGPTWDLGDFERTVHNKDKLSTIKFTFEFDLVPKQLGVNNLQPKLSPDRRYSREIQELAKLGLKINVSTGFANPGSLNYLSISSFKGIPAFAFSLRQRFRPEFTFLPKENITIWSNILFELSKDDPVIAQIFSKRVEFLWEEAAGTDEGQRDRKNRGSQNRSLMSRARSRSELLYVIETLGRDWFTKTKSAAEFISTCSQNEFKDFISALDTSAALHILRRSIDDELSAEIVKKWELPAFNLTLEKCSKSIQSALQRHHKGTAKRRGFSQEGKISTAFMIGEEFVSVFVKSLPSQSLATYWTDRIASVRFLVVIAPSIQIFPVLISDKGPKFLTDEPLGEFSFDETAFPFFNYLGHLISRTLIRLSVELDGITHIPAFRGAPRRTLDRDSSDEIAKSLDRLSKDETKRLNAALKLIGWSQEFNVGIESESGESRKIPKLTPRETKQKRKHFETLVDVGFGFSQLLPIVENAITKHPKIFLVEEPEVHLHPSLQGDLIELIARNSSACADIPMEKIPPDSPVGNQHRWFIETHSEYMLRRVQKLVSKGVLNHKAIAIYFCDIDENNERVVWPIKLGSRGQMLDPWPNDFIETALDINGLDSDSSSRER